MIDPKSDFISGLTDEQLAALRIAIDMGPQRMGRLKLMAEEDEKRAWLYALIRKSAAWVAGVVAMILAFRDDLSTLLSTIWRGGSP